MVTTHDSTDITCLPCPSDRRATGRPEKVEIMDRLDQISAMLDFLAEGVNAKPGGGEYLSQSGTYGLFLVIQSINDKVFGLREMLQPVAAEGERI
jgi:hypothetical protein